MVERGPEKAGVGGSIPSLATTLNYSRCLQCLHRPIRPVANCVAFAARSAKLDRMVTSNTGITRSAEPLRRALLTYRQGGVEHEVALDRLPFTIGRLPDRDLVLTEAFVSRQHAEIVQRDGCLLLCDLGSKGGCYVNGSRMEQHVLCEHDAIQIGSLEAPPIRVHLQNDTLVTPLRTLLDEMGDTPRPESGLGRLNWFLEAARRFSDLGAVHEIVGVLIESTLQLTMAERGFVFLRGGEGELAFVAGRDAQGAMLSSDVTVSRSAIQQAVASRSEFIITDTLSAEGFEPSASVIAHNLRVVICIPLRRRGAEPGREQDALLGVLYLDSRQQRGRLTSIDSNLLNVIAADAAALVENATLAEAEKIARQVRAELQIAAQIQRGLMAVRLPQLRYAEVDADSLPCKEIGGDFYDVLVIDGALHVVVADVSGKGVSAALLGAMLQGLVHAQLLAGERLDRIAGSANEFLCGRELGKYATMVLLRLQPDGRCEYINCGHVRPFRQGEQQIDVLTNSNMPVGLIAGATYTCEGLQLNADERVVIVTDGMTEAEDAEAHCYGDARLEAGLLRGATLQELLEELRSFTCGRPLEDDCTALEVRFRG